MKLFLVILVAFLDIVPGGKAYMKQLQPRDSILIADQIEYGFELENVEEGTGLALPDFSKVSNDTLTLVRNWQIDTLKVAGKKKGPEKRLFNIRAHIVLAPFEEGQYELPVIPLQRSAGGRVDTLLFEGLQMEVTTMPVDTATFEIKDIKGQMRYPLTFREIAPWLGGILLFGALCYLLVVYILKKMKSAEGGSESSDPAYIVALRKLEKYRSEKYWVPEKQKIYYSGITDALKEYIDERFGIDAPEMTTAELFAALKNEKDLTVDLYNDTKELFETADFVKFAKFYASDEDNAKALPLAVRFVTSTYQSQVEGDPDAGTTKNGGEAAAE